MESEKRRREDFYGLVRAARIGLRGVYSDSEAKEIEDRFLVSDPAGFVGIVARDIHNSIKRKPAPAKEEKPWNTSLQAKQK